ncbi:MAG: TRAP transporter substrate-binding protein [Pseudomonadota bacterium]
MISDTGSARPAPSSPPAPFDRRTAVFSGVAVLAAPAVVRGSTRELTLVATWPRGLPGLWDGAARFADRVTELSGGALKVTAFAAGEQIGAFESFDAVRRGDFDMYHGAEYYWQDRDRAFNFFTTVPFGFTADEFAAWVSYGGGQELWDQLSSAYGLKTMMCGNTGVQMGGWYNRPITSLADLKGLRIRIPGIAADIFRALGSEPVSLPGGAIPAALFAGEIDAVEWVGPYNDLNFGVQKVLRNYMYPGFHEPGTCASLGLNAKTWAGLDPADQAIIEAAARAENQMMPAQYAARSGPALSQMIREYGTNVMRFPDEIYAEVARIADETLAQIGSADPFARRVVESFLSFRAQIAPSSQRIKGQYVGLRSQALAQAQAAPQSTLDVQD